MGSVLLDFSRYGMKPLPRQAFGRIDAMMNTLILIPAFGCDAKLYAPQMQALEKFVRLQTIIPSADRYEKMVADVLEQAPDAFAILGTSMGGRLALEVTLAAPQRVTGLCVIGAGAGPVADRAAGLRRSSRIRGGEREQVVKEMADMISHLPGPRGPATRQAFTDMAWAFDLETLARQSDALAHRVDRWDELQDVEALTLCLWGEHDKFSPGDDGMRMAEAVDIGSFIEFPNCGHFPTLEYPDEATEAITMWLEDIDDVEEA
jgi:pimeloyl-ACP methyl ester carboxylesterase